MCLANFNDLFRNSFLLIISLCAFNLNLILANDQGPLTTYHVDPIAGDDHRDGLSPQTAWKTWDQFQEKAKPGYALLLKRGNVYALPFPVVGGSATTSVRYGAYGEGPKPIVHGIIRDLSQPKTWIEVSAEIWRTNADMPETANVILGNRLCGNMRYDITDLLKPGDWFQHRDGKGPLFVRSPGNPADIWRELQLVGAGHGIWMKGNQHSHIQIEDLRIQRVGTHGIWIDGANDVTIRRCDLEWIGGAIFRADSFSSRYGQRFLDRRVRFGNAIETWGSVSDVTVEGCRITDIFDGGFDIQGVIGTVATNVTARNNVFLNCGYDSLDIAHGIWTRNVLFEHNTCVNAGEGWAQQGEPWPRYSLNLPDCVGFHCNLESSYAWDKRCEVTIRKNIFFGAPKSRCLNIGSEIPLPSETIHIDSNCYFQPNSADAFAQIGGRPFIASQLNEFIKLTGWDRHSIIADPMFVDLAGGNFRLKSESPCAGMGAQSSLNPE